MPEKNFKLEQVLKYRTEIEKVRIQELFSARHELDLAAERVRMVEELLAAATVDFRSRQEELTGIDDIRVYSRYFSRKREELITGKDEVERLAVAVEERLDILVEASKDKKTLELLKERKSEEFRTAVRKREQNFMDEIATQKKKTAE